MKFLWLAFIFVFTQPVFSQAVFIEPVFGYAIPQNPSPNAPRLLTTAPGSSVSLCSYNNLPINGVPQKCTSLVTTYTDATASTACPTTQQAVQLGQTTCSGFFGTDGTFGFWVASPGTPITYYYSFVLPSSQQATVNGPYPISLNGGTGQAAGVNQFNGRQGNVTLTAADVDSVGSITNSTSGAASMLAAIPALCPVGQAAGGILVNGNATQCASLASAGVVSFNSRTNAVTLQLTDVSALGTLPNSISGTAALATALVTAPNLTAGTNMTITGTWPNLVFTSTGGGGLPTNLLFAGNYGSPATSPTGITAAIAACGTTSPCIVMVNPTYGAEAIPGSQADYAYPAGSATAANVTVIDQRTSGNTVINNGETNTYGNVSSGPVLNCSHTGPMLGNNIICTEVIDQANDGGVSYNIPGNYLISNKVSSLVQQNNATYGQAIAFGAGVNHTGVGDALAMSLFASGHGGQILKTDEGLEGFDIGVLQGSLNYTGSILGTVATTASGPTSVVVSISQGPSDINSKDQGAGRYMLRTQGVTPSASAVTNIVATAYGSSPATYTITGSSTLAVSTTTGTTATAVNPGTATPVTLTFATGSIGSITTSTLFCIADSYSSIEYVIPGAVGASTVTLTTKRPHPIGALFSTGGMCGYFISLTADNVTSSTYPTLIGTGVTGTMKRWWPIISSSATSGSGSSTTQTLQVAIQQQGAWQTQETQWTPAGNTGFSVAQGAEVYSVQSGGKVGNTWTLSPNNIAWTAGDSFELPHHPAMSAILGQLYIQQETPNSPGAGHAGVSFYGAVAGSGGGLWAVNNLAPLNIYKGLGGNFDPPQGFQIGGHVGGVLGSQYGGYYNDISIGCSAACNSAYHQVLTKSWNSMAGGTGTTYQDTLFMNENTGEWTLTANNGFTGPGITYGFTKDGMQIPWLASTPTNPPTGYSKFYFNNAGALCQILPSGTTSCFGSGGGFPLTSGLGVSVTGSSTYQVNINQTPVTITATTDNIPSGACGASRNYNAGSSAVAVALPQAGLGGNFVSGCVVTIHNYGTGTVTVTPSTSTINNGQTSFAVLPGAGWQIVSNGSNYDIGAGGSNVKSLAQVTSNWINSISTAGLPVASQPTYDDLASGNGTVPTTTGSTCGTMGTPVGGMYAGKVTAGAVTSCTIKLNFSKNATNGYFCEWHDVTTAADYFSFQLSPIGTNAFNQSSCISNAANIASGDTIFYLARPF